VTQKENQPYGLQEPIRVRTRERERRVEVELQKSGQLGVAKGRIQRLKESL